MKKLNLRMGIQLTYIFTFMFCLIGIVGNIETNYSTSKGCWVVTIISGILTVGKSVYCEITYKEEN